MEFSGTVTTLTREVIMKKVWDTVLEGNVGLMRLLGNAKPWRSGYRFDTVAKYQKSTVGGLVPVGGTLDTTRVNTRIKLQFEPQRIHKPVVVDDIEETLNQGDQKILDLVATESDSIAQDLGDDLGDYLYTGTGAASGASSFDSILNAADDSTNFANYGAQARGTYTTLKGYYVASVASLALADMSTAYDAVKVGSKRPSMILTNPSIWTDYEGLLQPTVRAGYQMGGYPQVTRTGVVSSRNGLRGDIGFDAVWYRGTPVVADEKCTSGKMFMVNEETFFFAAIDLKGYKKFNTSESNVAGPQAMPVPRGFNWSGMMRSTTVPGQVGHLYYVGNFVSPDPRRQGQMTGIT